MCGVGSRGPSDSVPGGKGRVDRLAGRRAEAVGAERRPRAPSGRSTRSPCGRHNPSCRCARCGPRGGPNEVPISIPKSSSIASRTASPGTPSGIRTPVTLAILWAWSPKRASPIALNPAVSARLARAWAREARFQPFGECDAGAFAGRVEHGGGLGMVVEAALAPVVHQHREIEVVRADDGSGRVLEAGRPNAFLHVLSFAHPGFHPLVERDGGTAGRSRETLLKAGGQHVDSPVVHPHVDAAGGGRRVHVEKRAVLAADRADLGERLRHRGGGVAVHDRHHRRPMLAHRGGHLAGLEHRPPTRPRWCTRPPPPGARPRTGDDRTARRSVPGPDRPARSGRPGRLRCRRGRSRPPGTSSGCRCGVPAGREPSPRSCTW